MDESLDTRNFDVQQFAMQDSSERVFSKTGPLAT